MLVLVAKESKCGNYQGVISYNYMKDSFYVFEDYNKAKINDKTTQVLSRSYFLKLLIAL